MGKPRPLPFRPFMGLYGDPNVFPCHSSSLVGHQCDAKLLHRSYIVFVFIVQQMHKYVIRRYN